MSEYCGSRRSSLFGRTAFPQRGLTSRETESLKRLGRKPAGPSCVACFTWLVAVVVFVMVVAFGVLASYLYRNLLNSASWAQPQQHQQQSTTQSKKAAGKQHVEPEDSSGTTHGAAAPPKRAEDFSSYVLPAAPLNSGKFSPPRQFIRRPYLTDSTLESPFF